MFGVLNIYSVRVRLPSGRVGRAGVMADSFTAATELANFLYPKMVLTMPKLETPEVEKEDPNING